MSNLFADVPVLLTPNISGPAVNVTALAADRTIVLVAAVGDELVQVILEGSTDGGVTFVPVWNSADPRGNRVFGVYGYVRARRVRGVGAISMRLGAAENLTHVWAALAVPPAPTGAGAFVDTSAMGTIKTFTISGAYSGVISIEGSNTDGASYESVGQFDAGGGGTFSVIGVWGRMRVRRFQGAGTPTVSMGAESLEVSGGSGAADWTANPRYFAVDYDNGSDDNAGFSDVSLALAGAVAKKTWEGFLAILPFAGNNRRAEVAVAARTGGAVYRNAADTANATFEIPAQYAGYARLSVRGTGTVPTAGAVAFADDLADQLCQGGRTFPGANVAGYRITKTTGTVVSVTYGAPVLITHDGTLTLTTGDRVVISNGSFETYVEAPFGWVVTVVDGTNFTLDNSDGSTFYDGVGPAAGATITLCKVVNADGSPAALPGGAVGRRLRGNVSNSAGANLCLAIAAVTADTIVFIDGPNALPDPDPVNDYWYIEDPGTSFQVANVQGPSGVAFESGANIPSLFLSGIRFSGSGLGVFSLMSTKSAALSFIGVSEALRVVGVEDFSTVQNWRNNGGSARKAGPSTISTGFELRAVQNLALSYLNASTTIINCPSVSFQNSLGTNFTLVSSGGVSTRTPPLNASQAAGLNLRLLGSVTLQASSLSLDRVQFDGAPATALSCVGAGGALSLEKIFDARPAAIEISGHGLAVQGTDQAISLGPNLYLRGGTTDGQDYTQLYPSRVFGLRCEDLKYGNLTDDQRNSFAVQSGGTTPQNTLNLGASARYANDDVADISRFNIVRPVGLVGTDITVGLPQADTVARASGDLLVASQKTFGAQGASTPMLCHADNTTWVISDDVPAVGDMMYLSTATPGNAMAAVPVNNASNAKRRLGSAIAVTTNGALTYVRLRWAPELLAVLADGLP